MVVALPTKKKKVKRKRKRTHRQRGWQWPSVVLDQAPTAQLQPMIVVFEAATLRNRGREKWLSRWPLVEQGAEKSSRREGLRGGKEEESLVMVLVEEAGRIYREPWGFWIGMAKQLKPPAVRQLQRPSPATGPGSSRRSRLPPALPLSSRSIGD